MNRREFLAVSAAPAFQSLAAEPAAPTIIDTHTHFYDPSRPESVPWPGKDDKVLYRTVLPDEFKKLVKPHCVTGTVVVEASPWPKDNDWLLGLAKKYPVIVGIVGRLFPGKDRFKDSLQAFRESPIFRGIRIGADELKAGLTDTAFRKDVGRFSDAELTLDINGSPSMLADVASLAKDFPRLRIVVNHMANVAIDGNAPPPSEWVKGIAAVAKQPMVWCKMSALVEGSRKNDGSAPKNIGFYRPVLDALWNAFGEDRLIFGSNWPVSDLFATYATVFGLADSYTTSKGKVAHAKVMGLNSIKAYELKINR
jgi:L-fuconolactonase